jgi:opacity protein-like surface antigen
MPDKVYLSLVAGLLSLSSATAQTDKDKSYPYYLGLGTGLSYADVDCNYYFYSDTECDGEDTSFKIYAGKRLYLLGIIPFEGYGFLYGKAGFMAWQTDYTRKENGSKTSSDDDGTDFTYGLGYAISFNNKFEIRLEYERLNELDDNFDSGGAYITNYTLSGNINFE